MSMLEQAIVDAKELREAAKANAEAEVLEKYSSQIKEAVDRLLEQEDEEEIEAGDLGAEDGAEVLDLDAEVEDGVEDDMPASYQAQPTDEVEEAEKMIDDASDALEQAQNVLDQLATQVTKIGEEASDEEMVTIDLDSLEDKVEAEEEEIPGVPETEATLEEELDLSEEELLGLAEALTVDLSGQKSGWAGRPDSQVFFEQELELARLQCDQLKGENQEFKEAVERLTENKNTLQKQLTEKQKLIKNTAVLIESLQNKLSESHLLNTKLFYSNKALSDSSLNERQKNRIVEAINKADATDKVKDVFETLCESVLTDSAKNAAPESLTEALKVRTLVARPTKKKTISESSDVLRMKKLAGIL